MLDGMVIFHAATVKGAKKWEFFKHYNVYLLQK